VALEDVPLTDEGTFLISMPRILAEIGETVLVFNGTALWGVGVVGERDELEFSL